MTEAFGSWLLKQRRRTDWVGQLGDFAANDRTFPSDGDPNDVRVHMARKGAGGDAFEMLDDAETEWLRLRSEAA